VSFSNLFFSFSFFLHTKQVHDYGRKVFEKIHVQNVVSWTTIIGGLVSYRDMDVAQRAFNQILTRNLWVYHLYNHRFFKINFELGLWVLYGFIKASCWFCETIICYKIPMFVVHREKYFGIIFRYILWLIFELLETYSSFSINRCYDQDERLNERFLVTCVWSKREWYESLSITKWSIRCTKWVH
jgi:hypothetical protein